MLWLVVVLIGWVVYLLVAVMFMEGRGNGDT
jgi:hypothetical protein